VAVLVGVAGALIIADRLSGVWEGGGGRGVEAGVRCWRGALALRGWGAREGWCAFNASRLARRVLTRPCCVPSCSILKQKGNA
jgi:hypothetical protein